jgi:uncharacterized protein YyaL (SSP411 family)
MTDQRATPDRAFPYSFGPDAEPAPREVAELLAAVAASLPPTYEPRTRHLQPDGRARFANRLLAEGSPYLRQHAHNPVDWHPWGDEAFAKARALDRPVLLSVGYSTCHWCHVMEEESFEDEEIAAFVNAHYVAVKVDREERPDVDSVYMAAVQALSGHGGWPMTVWLTPDRQPFYGGTYFPPRAGDRGARLGFIDLLGELARLWREDRGRADRAATELVEHVRAQLSAKAESEGAAAPALGADALDSAYRYFTRAYDPRWGGLDRAPKFPSNLPVRLMLRHWRRTGDAKALAMVEHTLAAMAAGGIRDHVGGGFHRYSVDAQWLVPHFEKMLYDNAQLACAYLEGWQASGRADFRDVAVETLDYVRREMTAPGGAFWSATDADSPVHDGSAPLRGPAVRREEGWFHTWTPAELAKVLGEARARVFATAYGVTEEGNFEGRTVLHLPRPLAAVASALGMPVESLAKELTASREELYRARAMRPPPLLDDKIITGWNGLMISAFATAGFALARADYVAAATRAAEFVFARLVEGGRLRRSMRESSEAAPRELAPACLEDYATMIGASLDLLTATGGQVWLTRAVALASAANAALWDADHGGYFLAPKDAGPLFVREKPVQDLAIPSGNALMATHLRRLAVVSGDRAHERRADAVLEAFAGAVARTPPAFGEMLLAVDARLAKSLEIVAVGIDPVASPLLAPLRGRYLPHAVVLALPPAEAAAGAEASPLFRGRVGGSAPATAVYVCVGETCGLPATNAADLQAQLAAALP